ncbi:hypothetical protein AYI68_g4231 [Smittium mucronatum]|uniref:Peptidase S1 domain-containing protein n=1 Tax=Smittium mucronatum TaxID=133383 RepID=A0A1R0GXN8_9FUNG|nr:hypothetical protein AYI68_g4231 [Smittium mucronatum]
MLRIFKLFALSLFIFSSEFSKFAANGLQIGSVAISSSSSTQQDTREKNGEKAAEISQFSKDLVNVKTIYSNKNGKQEVDCTGIILKPGLVLTTAECVKNKGSPKTTTVYRTNYISEKNVIKTVTNGESTDTEITKNYAILVLEKEIEKEGIGASLFSGKFDLDSFTMYSMGIDGNPTEFIVPKTFEYQNIDKKCKTCIGYTFGKDFLEQKNSGQIVLYLKKNKIWFYGINNYKKNKEVVGIITIYGRGFITASKDILDWVEKLEGLDKIESDAIFKAIQEKSDEINGLIKGDSNISKEISDRALAEANVLSERANVLSERANVLKEPARFKESLKKLGDAINSLNMKININVRSGE